MCPLYHSFKMWDCGMQCIFDGPPGLQSQVSISEGKSILYDFSGITIFSIYYCVFKKALAVSWVSTGGFACLYWSYLRRRAALSDRHRNIENLVSKSAVRAVTALAGERHGERPHATTAPLSWLLALFCPGWPSQRRVWPLCPGLLR